MQPNKHAYMQVWNNARIQVKMCKGFQVLKYAIIIVCNYGPGQILKYASKQAFKYASVRVCMLLSMKLTNAND